MTRIPDHIPATTRQRPERGQRLRTRPCSGHILSVFLVVFIAAFLSVPSFVFAWPLDTEWSALVRSGVPLNDPADGGNDRDIVGSAGPVSGACTASSCPAASLFNDGAYLYFRIRLDDDPSGLRPFGWGFLIDSNGTLTDYEWMLMVNGVSNPDQIEIDRNVIQSIADDPSDKAEVIAWSETAVAGSNYRVVTADSTFGSPSDPDFFLDFRIPYATFKSVTGLTDQSPIRFFVGTSNSAQTISDDMLALTISGGVSDVVLPLGTQPATGSVMFVSGLTGTGDVTQAYQGQTLFVKVTDADRNTSNATLQTVTVTVTTPDDSEQVTLTETGAGTGIFTGALATGGGAAVPGSNVLEVTPIVNVTSTYTDAIDAALNTDQTRTDALTILASADLAVTKTASNSTPSEGSFLDYTLTVANNGPNTATGIQILDLLPAGVKHESDTGAGAYNKNTGVWAVPSLASGASTTLVITVSVRNGTSGTTITNTANIAASSMPDPVSANNSSSVPITVGGADLAVTKSVSDPAPASGGSITYTVAVRNDGANNATGVQVTDLLPAGVSYTSHVVTQGTYTAANGVWTVGSLATAGTATLSLSATVTAAAGSTVTNAASITAADQADGNAGNNAASVQVFVAGADLAVAKAVSDASPNEGSAISYRVVVLNNGPGSPAGVQVTDLLPAGLTFTSALASQGTYSSSSGIWTIGALATSATLTINATVNAGTNGQTLTNTAAITASSVGDPVPGNNSAGASLTVQRAEVAVSKLVSTSSPTLGAPIFYTIVARNNGPNAATNLQVTDVLPSLVTYASHTVAPAGSTYDPGTGLWNIGTLASGATTTLRINVTVSGNSNDALKTVINSAAKTSADQADPVSANNAASASFTIQGCDLAVTKSVSDPSPAPGSNVVFTVAVRNNGPFTSDKNVTVYDVLPAGLAYVSDTTSAGNYNNASGAWNFGNTTIASGATHTMTLTATVTAPAGSVVTNSANNAATYDFDLSNNLATAAVYVGGTDIAVTKSVSTTTPNAGDTVIYTVGVRNNGPNQATNLIVSDLLASGLTYTSSAADQGTYAPGSGAWTIGTLASGAATTLSISAVVDAGTGGGTIVNTAFLQSMTGQDPNSANNSASVPITALAADLAVTKTASSLTPNELDPVVFTVTVANNGPNDATGVIVQDILASGLTYSSHLVSQGTYSAASGAWAVGAVAKSASATLQITAVPDIGTGGTNIANTASVLSAGQEDPVPANNSATITITPVAVPFPNIVIVKTVQTVSDPFNLGLNPKAIPGAEMLYEITVTNQGNGTADNITIWDSIPANTTLITDIAGPDSGPVVFLNGSVPSGLTYTFTDHGSGTDTIEFSTDNTTWNYTPSAGSDPAVRYIRLPLSGTMNAAVGASQPSFTVRFKVLVQ